MTDVEVLRCCDLQVKVRAKTLLQKLSFTLNKGEHLAIIGPNGAGKSTLIKALLGVSTKATGEVALMGRALSSMARREVAQRIAYVPQLVAAEIPYTVREFVTMGRYSFERGGEAIERAMAAVQVTALSERIVSTLSGGERQRVCIAAALAQEAPVIVFDEPLAHLDPGQKIEIQRVIRELQHEVTVIVVTHDLIWARNDFSRLIAIADAALVYDGVAQAFFVKDKVDHLFGRGVSDVVLGGGCG